MSDEDERLARVRRRAEAVFGSAEVAHDWLRTPNRALGGVPHALCATEEGAVRVERILGRIEHGVYS